MQHPLYRNRHQAGRLLAERLKQYAGKRSVLVLGLPRGGVPVAFEIADAFGADVDIYLVRKLGVPGHEELAMGAVAAGDIRFLNEPLIRRLAISDAAIDAAIARELEVLERQSQTLRGDVPPPTIAGKTVILVDDGLATGATMAAAIMAVRKQNPEKIVVAVPVAPPETCDEMKRLADEVVCPATPELFGAVGLWYVDFSPVEDEQVRELLRQAREGVGTGHA